MSASLRVTAWVAILALATNAGVGVPPPAAAAGRDMVAVAATGAPAANEPFVIKPKFIDPARAAAMIAQLFPNVRTRADVPSGSVIVFAEAAQADLIRSTFDALDQKGATVRSAQAFPLHAADANRLAVAVGRLYPSAHVEVTGKRMIVVSGTTAQLTEIAAIVASIDAPPSPAATTEFSSESVALTAARPADVARDVSRAVPGVHATVSGTSVILTGPPDDVTQAKALVANLDVPPANARYPQVYRLRAVDAASVAALIRRTFPDVSVDVDAQLNAFTATATSAEQQRIAAAVAQLDGGTAVSAGGLPVSQPGHSTAIAAANGTVVDVVTLRAAAPGLAGTANAASTTANDIAEGVLAALKPIASDLNITVPANNPSQLIVTGSEDSVRLAKQVIAQLDVAQKLVVLDTEILEVDETAARNLGLSLGSNPSISTTYTETTPAPAANGLVPPLLGLQQLSRTALSFSVTLGLLVSNGNARILADPRITTISGRTATIRAGDNITILTTTGGATGTIATTQLQTFQTGVTLDITPVINADNFITVSLHPVVNSLTGTNNGVPQISTRDTQTTVAMQAEQTLVIGGLIQDNTTKSETRIPFLGDLPLIGKAFRNSNVNYTRNELIITVTPHVVNPSEPYLAPVGSLTPPPPAPLPTIPPDTPFPTPPAVRPAAPAHALLHFPPSSARKSPAAAGTPAPGTLGGTPRPTTPPLPFSYVAPPSAVSPAPNAIQILSASFSPVNVKNNTNVSCVVVTTKAVTKVTIGYGGFTTQLSSVSPGIWQANYNFSTIGLPIGQSQVPLSLIATGLQGAPAQITIPVNVSQ